MTAVRTQQIRIALAQDDSPALGRLRRIAAGSAGFEVVADHGPAPAFLGEPDPSPDVVVVGSTDPESAVALAVDAAERWPDAALVAFPAPLDEQAICRLFDEGAIGFMSLDCSDEDIEIGITAASRGESFLCRASTRFVMPRAAFLVRALADVRRERQRLEEVKRQFASILSHEVLTPAAILQGVAHTLAKRRDLPDELAQPLVDSAHRAGAQLTKLLANLSLAAAIDTGARAPERRQVRIVRLVDSLSALVASDRLVLDISVDDDATAMLDAQMMLKALTGVVENCLELSPPAEPVHLGLVQVDRLLEIKITDRGSGIPADRLDGVFDLFTQVDSSDTREHRGSGIGLYLARRTFELHGGSIAAWSGPDGGTTFIATLPLV